MAKRITTADTSTTPTANNGNATNIKTLMGAIDFEISKGSSNSNLYYKNREIIKSLFNPAIPYSVDVVYKRLVVIDALYSTNMNRRYYGIEDMANTIDKLSPSDVHLRKLVREFRDKLFKGGFSAVSSHPIADAFGKDYGIHKKLEPAGSAMSLLSKYFYFLLLTDHTEPIGFPIYDSLANKMYPIVCDYLYASGTPIKIVKFVKNINHLCDYFLALDQLRISIGISYIGGRSLQEFDLLDAYLWRMGKFRGNNFSLLLDEGNYRKLIHTAVPKATKTSEGVIRALGVYRENKNNVCPIDNPLFNNLWDHANALGI